jgi:Xaa-Pro aminopeptidase
VTQERLADLRNSLIQRELTGVIVPITNAFQGEYSPACDHRLQWLTGFTGSNGMAIVLLDKAAFFTDGRYTIQAQNEVDTDSFEIWNMADTPAHKWLKANVEPEQRIACDPWLHTKKQLSIFEQGAKETGYTLISTPNLIDPLWTDRPAPPNAAVRIHPEGYAGQSSADKRKAIAATLQESRSKAAVLSAGDSICWLLNIRGGDIPHTPFLLAYAILHQDASVDLFYDPAKCSEEVRQHLGNDVRIRPISEVQDALKQLANERVHIDPARVSAWFFEELKGNDAELFEETDPCQTPKAIKNDVEQEGAKQAHLRDGVAVTKFLAWFDEHAPKGQLTEIDAAERLTAFRQEQELFQETSFETISGYGPNGAIIHYRVSEESNLPIQPGNLYLVDSGGQYLDGTTDITRTLPVGEPTDEQKQHVTLVLKGMIQLTLAQFPKGTSGGQLDILARQALWQAGLDYGHGTGHGIGSYLSVHEGPQGVSHRSFGAKLEPGMLLSNEPGYYREGHYGIRIENVIMVTARGTLVDGEKEFYGFDTLTLAPIDRRLIEPSLLTTVERNWLDAYHQRVREELSPFLDDATNQWLTQATAPLAD